MWKGRVEKETAMRRRHLLRQIGMLLRFFEAASAVLLLSWSYARAPAAARLSADFFRRLTAVLLSPRFVFLIGNAIVLLLFSKSHRRYSSHSSSASAADMIYQEFLESRGSGGHLPCSQAPSPPEEVIYDDKEVCIETPAYQRSRSERMRRRRGARPGLRRAATDLGMVKRTKSVQEYEDEKAAEAEAEAEEFRRVVEAFIAKQTRFLREEECSAAVLPSLSSSAGTP
ncbi:uncharacterized protein LOC141828701 [Curcuma longa]|uniref:uncharacterized protein LOC141828701 n=1 Tax=Curcuma longa TaxID=136217 RepID=UPI003D9F4B8E